MFNELKRVPQRMLEDIKSSLRSLNRKLLIMHFCGTHQYTIVKYGIDDFLLQYGIEVREGPGCPVCVTTTKEIEVVLKLAREGITITTFGDLMKVPGATGSLSNVQGKVRVVYSIEDSIEYARKNKDEEVVFVAVGFETTMPTTAAQILEGIPENHYILSFHKFTPPAMEAVLKSGEINLDGIILPGHVSTIIGARPWRKYARKYKIPMVISGFEPLDVLISVKILVDMLENEIFDVFNEYTRSVTEEGNKNAKRLINEAFNVTEAEWRGFGLIKNSGADLRKEFEDNNARKVFSEKLSEVMSKSYSEPAGCRCGDVIRGVAVPQDCPLFGKACTPEHPVGPCMVSSEGACSIVYKFKRAFNIF